MFNRIHQRILVALLVVAVANVPNAQAIEGSSTSTSAKEMMNPEGGVSLATGDLGLSIPLFSVAGRGVDFPLVLNYQSGAKVDEEASPVGFGFSLSTGFIMNIVKGCGDDNPSGCTGQLNGGGSNEERDQDFFVMNIGGRTTRLMYDNTGVFHTIPWQPIKIQYWDSNGNERPAAVAGARIVRFLVTMPDGTRYYFNHWRQTRTSIKEISRVFETADATGNPVSPSGDNSLGRQIDEQRATTWYLSAITAPNFKDNTPSISNGTCPACLTGIGTEDFGGWVTFSYADLANSNDPDRYLDPPGGGWQVTQHDAIRKPNGKWIHQYSFYQKAVKPEYFYPSQITSPLFKAVFTLGTRSDLNVDPEARRINTIELKRNNASSTPVAKVVFGYDSGATALAQGAPYSSNGRLTLRSITKYGADGTTALPPLTFSYYNDDAPVAYNREKVDFWGNRNNAATSTSSVWAGAAPCSPYMNNPPSWCGSGLNIGDSNFKTFLVAMSADATRFAPDLISARAWNLKSMSTPSGATISYVYELDTYDYEQEEQLDATKTGGGLRVASVTTNDGFGSSTTVSYQYEEGVVLRHAELSNSATLSSGEYTSFFIGGYSERQQIGSEVAYARTTEILPGFNGKIEREFTTSREIPDTIENRWGHRLTSQEWKRGFENATTFYDSSNNVVRTVTNTYEVDPSNNRFTFLDDQGNSDGESDWDYTIETGWIRAKSSITTERGISIEKRNSNFNVVNGMPELIETYRPYPTLVDQKFVDFAITSGAGIGAQPFIDTNLLTAVSNESARLADQTRSATGVQNIFEQQSDGRIFLKQTFATAGVQWVMQSRVDARNDHGLPTEVFSPLTGTTTTAYDATGTIPVMVTNALGHVSEVEQIQEAFLAPEVTKAPDGTRSKTEFDTFGRSLKALAVTKVGNSYVPVSGLRGISSSDSAVAKANYDNLFKGTALSATNPNELRTTTVLGSATTSDPYKNQEKVDSLDGLGRTRKSYVSATGVATTFCTVQTYDVMGAVETSTGPSGITSQTIYEADPRHRPKEMIPNTATPTLKTSMQYGADPTNGLFYTVTTSPKGDHANPSVRGFRTYEFKDVAGRTTKTIQEGKGSLADRLTVLTYDGPDLKQLQDPKGLITKFFYDNLGRKIGTKHPDQAGFSSKGGASIPENVSEQWDYDPFGRLIRYWNTALAADNKHLHTFYDSIGRETVTCSMLDTVTKPTAANCDTVDLSSLSGRRKVKIVKEYDLTSEGTGKLGRVSNGVTTTELTYDALGRVSQKTVTFDTQLAPQDNVYVTKFGYNNAGELEYRTFKPAFSSSVDPSSPSNVIRYTRDGMGRLTEVAVKKPGGTSFTILANGYEFTSDGLLEEFTRGSGVKSTFTYDPDRRWMTGMELSGMSASSRAFARSYERDDHGNIFRIYDGVNLTGDRIGDFTFDVFTQLTNSTVRYQPSSACGNCTVTEGFGYDVDGNRTSYSYSSPSQSFSNRTLTYVPNTNRLQSDHRGIQYVYDDSGNVIQKVIP